MIDSIERAFYGTEIALLGRWWNGRYGRLARRDIWLHHEQAWRVEARQGDGDSAVWSHDYPTEAEAGRHQRNDQSNRRTEGVDAAAPRTGQTHRFHMIVLPAICP